MECLCNIWTSAVRHSLLSAGVLDLGNDIPSKTRHFDPLDPSCLRLKGLDVRGPLHLCIVIVRQFRIEDIKTYFQIEVCIFLPWQGSGTNRRKASR